MASPPSPGAEARALSLLSLDPLPWAREWATWRLRFLYDNARPGLSHAEIAEFVREAVAPLARRRADCAGEVLYLLDGDDLAPIFRAFGAVIRQRGAIGSIQSRRGFHEAAQIANALASTAPEPAGQAEAVALPDLSWQVSGFGLGRIARARVRGHAVVVRMAPINGQEMWLLDIDDQPGCARFRLRQDAMSKMGVAAALRACERRLAR